MELGTGAMIALVLVGLFVALVIMSVFGPILGVGVLLLVVLLAYSVWKRATAPRVATSDLPPPTD
jgi:4-hydroxybenzoate polyprenyltransferase